MFNVGDTLLKLATGSGFAGFFANGGWQNLVMIVIACVLLYLGIVKGFEPLLLVGIAFGCLLANVSYFPGLDAVNPELNATNAMYHPELWSAFLDSTSPYYHSYGHVLSNAGLLDIFYIGVKAGLYPSLIFMGVGAMTDFGPLIADPKSLLLGAAAQLGVFVAFFGAICLGFTGPEAASIGIIGGADGPTAIFLTNKLAPHLLGAIAIAAYSYMALIPMIQPPIFLSTSVGATMVASNFLKAETLKIIFLGLVAFGISTTGGLIGGNIMCKLSGKKVNPLIGSAGVSAVPMAARVSQMVGQKANPANFLLMHAMGPNVAGVIGSAIAAGFLLAVFG